MPPGLCNIRSTIKRSAETFGNASRASPASSTEEVVKPACANRLLYKSIEDESSSTRNTVFGPTDAFALIIFVRYCIALRHNPPGYDKELIRTCKKHVDCQPPGTGFPTKGCSGNT